jgi:GDPmannose 4,6-dehydratase
MKAIIFGANGQDGFYLSQLLASYKVDVIGVSRNGDFLRADISDYSSVLNLIETHLPDYVFHLAANSTTQHAVMFENHATIETGTLNILEAVRLKSPQTKVFISGSALQFKNENRPIKETNEFEANDPYAVSRIQSVYAARYFRKLGIKVYVGYFFNHDSPRRTEKHLSQKIAKAVVRISKGSDEKIEIGDLDAIKEYTFAGDVVKGLWLFINQEQVFEANISSGIGYSVLDWVKICFELVGLDYKNYVVQNHNFKSEYKKLVSDPTVIRSLGFNPEVSFEALAKMMIKE